MKEKKSSMEQKFDRIKNELGNQMHIYVDDIQMLFPNLSRNSLYWTLSKMVSEGHLKRVRNGIYTINGMKDKSSVLLSSTATNIQKILDEEGFEYYISGLDVLSKFMQHVPDKYPIIVFVERAAYKEMLNILNSKSILTYEPTVFKESFQNFLYTSNNANTILYKTDNFDFQENNIATTEKAFLDIYYAVTRNKYPLAIQELVRIYKNAIRLGAIDKKKLISISYKRSLQYDIRFIVESNFISEGAIEFVKYFKQEY